MRSSVDSTGRKLDVFKTVRYKPLTIFESHSVQSEGLETIVLFH